MNHLTTLFAQPWAERLGWTLVHFLWQGAAIAILYAALGTLPRNARWRYLLACSALGAMLTAPLATLGWMAIESPGAPAVRATTSAAPLAALDGVAAGAPLQNALPWLVMAWLCGVLAFSTRLAGGWISAARMRSSGAHPATLEWQDTLDRLAHRLGVSRPVRLLVSTRVDAPAVLGWLRPVVLAPLGALTGLPRAQVEALLIHELAHILRNDYLVNLFQGVAEAVLFYHPAVWWISNRVRVERELCCDDLAVAASGDVLTYARALAELERCRPRRATAVVASNGASLILRIRRLVEPSRPSPHALAGPGAAWALSVLLLVAIGTAAVRGAPTPPPQGQRPTVERSTIWTDTVKLGDVALQVRGLGLVTSATNVELKIAERQMKQVEIGLPATIAFRPNGIVKGRVFRKHGDLVNGVSTVDVQVEGALPPSAQPGTQVDGSIQVGALTNVIYVGRPVLGETDQEASLFRLEPDGSQAVQVKVRFGRASINQIEIRSGLQPGDKVIVSDMSKYKDQDRVYLK